MLSFGVFKEQSGAKDIAGVSVESAKFKELLNTSTRRLLNRGDFLGTLIPIFVCASNGCITWPRYVGQVRKMYTCLRDIRVQGLWYQFLDRREWRGWCGTELSASIVGPGWWNPNFQSPAINQGRYPVHQDIMGDGRYIRLYHRCQQDLGKTVTIFGVDNGNQPLRHRIESGEWRDGIRMVLQHPYAQSTTFVRRVDRVVKEDTQCQVLAFAVNTNDNDVLEDLAIWDGSEVNPSRLRQKAFIGCGCNDSGSSGVTALVKLAYVPVRYDDDWVLIDNMDALSLMFQCIKAEQGGNREAARGYELDAVREGNLQLLNEMPDLELPIDVQPTSGVQTGWYQPF